MTLSLYEYKDDTSIENKFSWAPEENQWWITGFDSTFTEPVPDNMGVVGSVNFSTNTKLYYDLRDTYFVNTDAPFNMNMYQFLDGKTCLVFDDEVYAVWIVWRETKSCQENV